MCLSFRHLLMVVAAGLLGACAAKPSVSEHQCLAGDWQTIGYHDASLGYPSTRLLSHQEACGPHGVIPQRTDYMVGWQEGLSVYCTADNGFDLGSRGKRHNGICRGADAGAFQAAYDDGWELFQARSAARAARQALQAAEQRLKNIKQEIVGASTAQLIPDLTVQERVQLVADLNALIEERDQVLADLPQLRADLARREQELDALQHYLAGSAR